VAGRHYKEGLDYFELDCHLDSKIRLIQAEFGLAGFAIVVLLFQRIYGGHGYYMTWDEDELLLFMSDNGVHSGDKNLINEIVKACIRRDIFSKDIFDAYHVLTSHGIQKRYMKVASKRENKNLKKEYLLLSDGQNLISASEIGISGEENSISDTENTQSRVEKSRVEKSRVEKSREGSPPSGGTHPPKCPYGEYGHVLLTDRDREMLFNEYGEAETLEAIKFLDEYIERKDYKDNNHFLCLKRWVFDAVKERKEKKSSGKGSSYMDAINNRLDVVKEWAMKNLEGGD